MRFRCVFARARTGQGHRRPRAPPARLVVHRLQGGRLRVGRVATHHYADELRAVACCCGLPRGRVAHALAIGHRKARVVHVLAAGHPSWGAKQLPQKSGSKQPQRRAASGGTGLARAAAAAALSLTPGQSKRTLASFCFCLCARHLGAVHVSVYGRDVQICRIGRWEWVVSIRVHGKLKTVIAESRFRRRRRCRRRGRPSEAQAAQHGAEPVPLSPPHQKRASSACFTERAASRAEHTPRAQHCDERRRHREAQRAEPPEAARPLVRADRGELCA